MALPFLKRWAVLRLSCFQKAAYVLVLRLGIWVKGKDRIVTQPMAASWNDRQDELYV